MVVDHLDEETADRLFRALADGTRRDIVRRALRGEYSVSALARLYPMSFAAVQKHVAVLERAGLVAKQRHGREQRVHTEISAIHTVQALLDEVEALWRDRMDRFEKTLQDTIEGDDQ